MRLFSEKVVPTFTSSNLNILTVEDFQEVFFDVFEFEINGKKFVAEKVSEYKGSPVVDIPLVLEGKEFTSPFVLQTGKFEILFNKNNSTFVREVVVEQQEPVIEYTDKYDEVEEIIFEKKEDILKEIAQARLSAEIYVDKLKQQKINEAAQYFDEKKKSLDDEINESKKGLLDEFLSLVENIKSEFFEFNENEREKLSIFIESSISELADQLVKSIGEKQEVAEKRFNEQLNELATNILSGVLLKEISSNSDKSVKDINERFALITSNLKTLLRSERDQIDENVNNRLNEFNDAIISLEKTNIELNDLINKGDNRALSRIGNVKSQLEETILSTKSEIVESIQFFDNQIIEGLADKINIAEANITDFCNAKIETAEDKIKAFYDNKISLIEERVEDLSVDNKQYFLNLVNESKQSLLNEIANIKVDVPNIVIEKSNGKQEVDLKGIKSELEKIIGTRFSNELQALKRLIEMSSGGGSVAKQFAAGGTMEGTLNVTGQYLSGGVDLLTIFAGGGDDIEVNTVVRSSSANWNNAYNTGTVYQVNSASYATIDFANSKFFPLSGGTITGATVINNNLTVNGNLTATGTTTFNNTVFSVTSALSVVHVGEGPAVWVGNSGLGDIASFYDIDENIEVFHIGGSNGTFPNVGVRTSTPNKTFTVVGEISSTSDITTSGSIGIGTPTPNERLTVSGNISARGTVTADTIDFSNSTSFLQPSSDVRSWYEYGIGPSIPVSETSPSGLFFKPDGLVVYIIGFSLDLVRSFALTTPWDITTQSNTASSTLLVTAAETTPQDLHFSPDGVYLFIVGQTGTVPQPGDRVYRFTLSTPWDITTAVYDGIANALSVSDKETTPLGLTMSNDGTRLYVCGTDSDNIDQYNLTTSWSLSTAVHAHTINIAAQEPSPNALAFNSDGTRLYVTGSTGDDITEYRLATPWEISTASYFSESFTILTETVPTGLFINSLTNDAYLIGSSLDRVLQFKTDRQLNYNGDSFVMDSQLYVGGRAEFKNTLYANSNATILGSLAVGNNITGTGLTTFGTTTLANTTNAVTVSIATGATTFAKTILIGTNSRFTSPTNVTIGSLDDSGGTTFQHPVRLNKNAIFDNAITVKGAFDPISSAAVATGAIAISDTFTEAADTLLQNHIPDIGTSWSRIQVNSATTSFTIEASTDTLKPTATAADNGVIYIENTTLTNPDYEVSVDLPVQASADDVIWLIARYQDVNNFYGVRWSTTAANCTLYKRVGGTFTQLSVTPYINPATGSSNLSLRVVGNRIAVVNGGQTKIAFTDDSLTAAGKAGLAGGNIGVLSTDDLINTWRLDNFKVQYYTDAASTFEKGDVIIGSGKVGIGTASPSESLTVVGNISASGNITANNLVYTSENQSISGVKTFNDLPIIPITPISDDNPTSKEYVDSLVSSVSSSIQDSLLDIITNSSSVFSLSTIYNNKVVQCTSTTPITATLPASLPQGFNCMLIQLSSGQINIQGDSGVTVGSFGNLVKTAGQHAPVSIICLAPGIYNVSGNLI